MGVRSFLVSQAIHATMPVDDFCRPVRMNRSILSPDSGTNGRSPEVISTAFRTQPPNLQTVLLMGYGLRGHLPARPAPYASDPVLVHRLVRLLHASFRPSVAGTPLRFANPSPPSGWVKDFHLQTAEHARHTTKKPPARAGGFVSSGWDALAELVAAQLVAAQLVAAQLVAAATPLNATAAPLDSAATPLDTGGLRHVAHSLEVVGRPTLVLNLPDHGP